MHISYLGLGVGGIQNFRLNPMGREMLKRHLLTPRGSCWAMRCRAHRMVPNPGDPCQGGGSNWQGLFAFRLVAQPKFWGASVQMDGRVFKGCPGCGTSGHLDYLASMEVPPKRIGILIHFFFSSGTNRTILHLSVFSVRAVIRAKIESERTDQRNSNAEPSHLGKIEGIGLWDEY